MTNKCCDKKVKVRNKNEQEELICHINRITGQLNGIKQMIEDSRYCDDILTQIAAANSSLKSLGISIMENHMRTCVKEEIKKGNDEIIVEVMKTFQRLSR